MCSKLIFAHLNFMLRWSRKAHYIQLYLFRYINLKKKPFFSPLSTTFDLISFQLPSSLQVFISYHIKSCLTFFYWEKDSSTLPSSSFSSSSFLWSVGRIFDFSSLIVEYFNFNQLESSLSIGIGESEQEGQEKKKTKKR